VPNQHGKTISYQFFSLSFTPRNCMTILLLFDHGCLAQRDRVFVSGFAGVSTIYRVVHLPLYTASMLLVSFGEK